MENTWWGYCQHCKKVYHNPDGLLPCCNDLATLCRNEYGDRYSPERKKPVFKFIDPEFNLFSDMAEFEKKEMYWQSWKKENRLRQKRTGI